MKYFLSLAILAFCAAFFAASPAEATFRQDPGNGCLCPDDPFCDCGNQAPGGGDPNSTGECQECRTENRVTPNGTTYRWEGCVPKTTVGQGSRTCTVEPANGTGCYLSGQTCWITSA